MAEAPAQDAGETEHEQKPIRSNDKKEEATSSFVLAKNRAEMAKMRDEMMKEFERKIGRDEMMKESKTEIDKILAEMRAKIRAKMREYKMMTESKRKRDKILAEMRVKLMKEFETERDEMMKEFERKIGRDHIAAEMGDNIADEMADNMAAEMADNIAAEMGDKILAEMHDKMMTELEREREMTKLRARIAKSANKEEQLEQFRELVKTKRRDPLVNLVSIDFSHLSLSPFDVIIVGIVANMAVNLESLDIRGCQLQKGSLIILESQLTSLSSKIGKLFVAKNPDLSLGDLKAGMDITLRSGGVFIYDNKYLSTEDLQQLKFYKRHLQASKPKSTEGFRKRKHMTREERFQNLYKGRLSESDLSKLKTCRLDFSKNLPSLVEGRDKSDREMGYLEVPDIPDAFSFKEPSSSSDEIHIEKTGEDQEYQIENINMKENALRRKKKVFLPLTMKDHVKFKPLDRFQQALKDFEEGKSELPEANTKFRRNLKTLAMLSDRKRFQSLSMKDFASSHVRHNVRVTQLKACSTIMKSSKGDSGYKSRSTFELAMSDKASLRQYAMRDSQEVDGDDNSLLSTQHPSDRENEEVPDSSENQSSQESKGPPPSSKEKMAKSDWDPRRLQQQRFEMTCLGLGISEDLQERVQNWINTEDFQQDDEPEEEDLIASQLSNIAITDTSSSSTSSGSSSTNIEDSAYEKVTQSITEIAEQENFEYGFTKLRKKTTILTSGGRISIDECYIDFPQNCFDTDTDVTLSLDMDYRSVEIPDNSTPITPIVGVEHKGELNLEAAINIPSWYKPVSVFEHVKIFKSMKSRDDSKSKFLFERNATLSNGYITFLSKHFCGRFSTAAISSVQNGSISLAHALLHNDDNFKVIVCFLNPSKLLGQKIKHYTKRGYKEIHQGCFELDQSRTKVELKSVQPDFYKFHPELREINKSDLHKTKRAKHFLQNTVEKNFMVIPASENADTHLANVRLEYTVNGNEPEPFSVRVTPAPPAVPQYVVKGAVNKVIMPGGHDDSTETDVKKTIAAGDSVLDEMSK